jgi:DNA-binding NarL/FixJ family response regulator
MTTSAPSADPQVPRPLARGFRPAGGHLGELLDPATCRHLLYHTLGTVLLGVTLGRRRPALCPDHLWDWTRRALSDAGSCKALLMDLMMPVMDGVSATREIRRHFPQVEVLALTSALEEHTVAGAIAAGATGDLLEDASVDALTEAMHAAARSEVRLHPEAACRLLREFRTPEMRERLTPRESLILTRIARGWANRTIAQEPAVSEPTVKTPVSRLLGKLERAGLAGPGRDRPAGV